jgi:hypothetical protein
MATIIHFPVRHRSATITDSQLDAVKLALKLLGPDHAEHFPILSAALAHREINDQSRPLNGTASRNTVVASVSSCA